MVKGFIHAPLYLRDFLLELLAFFSVSDKFSPLLLKLISPFVEDCNQSSLMPLALIDELDLIVWRTFGLLRELADGVLVMGFLLLNRVKLALIFFNGVWGGEG